MICFNNLSVSTIRSGRGDCILIRYLGTSGLYRNIVVDTGPTSTSGAFRKLCSQIIYNGESFDILLISHYDDDHIGGALKVTDIPFQSIYFNAYNGSAPNANLTAIQNQRLFHMMMEKECFIIPHVLKGDIIDLDGAKIEILAPTKQKLEKVMGQIKTIDAQLAANSDWIDSFDVLMEQGYPKTDSSIANQSSVVFLLEYCGFSLLFCGDAPAECILDGLHDIDCRNFDLVKLPHHGSIRNISDALLNSINADSFLICADGSRHPDKQTLAKLLKWYGTIKIYSNYSWWISGFILKEDYKYITEGRLFFDICT